MLTAVDLFCGAGGSSLGLIQAGIHVAGAYDNMPAAIHTYNANIAGNHAMSIDLSDVDLAVAEISKLQPDIISGSPPCQDFSTAGSNYGKGQERALLTVSFAEIIAKCQPQFWLMENVMQARNHHQYKAMIDLLQSHSYSFVEIVLNASFYGVPQARKRLFVFGWLEDNLWLGSRFQSYLELIKTKAPLTVKEYLGDEIDVDYFWRKPIHAGARSVWSVHEPAPTIVTVNPKLPKNYKSNNLKEPVDPLITKTLSYQLRARIQTFPKNWQWLGKTDAENERLVGNAVPVELMRSIGCALLRAIQ